MIDIRPDPAHPHGGYAELRLSASDVQGDAVEISVFDNYSERFLGEAGWQATRVAFGPYTVDRDGDTARLLIGPEIVNQIEEYANVRLDLGGVSQDVSWPDEIVPAPGAAKIGGILSARKEVDQPGPGLAVSLPGGAEDAETGQDSDEQALAPDDSTETALSGEVPVAGSATGATVEGGGRKWLLSLLAVLVLAAAGAAYFLLQQSPEPEPETVAPEPVVQPEPVEPVADTCGLETLRGLDGFASQYSALQDCGADVSADTALTLVEQAAARGDAEALTVFGELYDGERGSEVIEDQIGLTFGDEPATAADYYARAVEAGSGQAVERLRDLCSRLETMTSTLAKGAYDDHCGS